MRAVLIIALVLSLAACSTARRSEPIAGPLNSPTALVERGHVVFDRQCSLCHTSGEASLAPALNNKPLPGFMIRLQVRRGFGAMPAFDEAQISDEDLDAIVAYLKALRAKPAS